MRSQALSTQLSHSHLTSDPIVLTTIQIIKNCPSLEFLSIAHLLKEISEKHYTDYYPRKLLNEIRLHPIENCRQVKKIAENISLFSAAYTLDTRQTALQNQLKNAVYSAALNTLKRRLSFKDIAHIACALDCVNYAQYKCRDPIFTTIVTKLYEQSRNNQDLSSDVWTIFALRKAKMLSGTLKKSLFIKICQRIVNQVNKLSPLHISLIMKGLAQASHEDKKLFDLLRRQTIAIKEEFTVSPIVNVVWSFCHIENCKKSDPSVRRKKNKRLVQAFKDKLIDEMSTLDEDQIARIAWVFKNLQITDSNFFEALCYRLESLICYLTSERLITLTKVLSNIHLNDCTGFIKLLEEITQRLDSNPNCFSEEEIIQVTYSVLIKFCQKDANFQSYELFLRKMLYKIASLNTERLNNMERCMINVIYKIFSNASCVAVEDQQLDLQKHISRIKDHAYLPYTSNFQKNVEKHLGELVQESRENLNVVSEVIFERIFRLDIVLLSNSDETSQALVVEVDGQCHFSEEGDPMLNNCIKEHLLKLKKWEIIRISYKEWPGYRQSYHDEKYNAAKRQLLLEKLSTVSIFKEMFTQTLCQIL